ncbi:MAG: hypothetical protein FWH20_05870 [Oscillospiraceae bacterium]|nr:hypothetical protein [Oscillospiraceae bacterium]
MKQKSFPKLTLIAIGHAAIGNLLSLIVTISLVGLAGIFGTTFLYILAAICSIALFFMFTYSGAYKDGERERKLLARKVIAAPAPNKWLVIGGIVAVLFSVPSILLIFMPEPPFLYLFRLVLSPSVMALSLLFRLESSPGWAPFVYMGLYALTPIACRMGYNAGFYDKVSLESIIYKKK